MRKIVTVVAVFAAMNMVQARSCIVDAGMQTYEVSTSVSEDETSVVAARTATVKVSTSITEMRRRMVALSSAGSLSTMPLGSVLILR